eukprot:m.13171 g.13171  ORF g.13171 m.13171 type:complete len:273 (+) comp9614_c0_seq1:198-1016(+)
MMLVRVSRRWLNQSPARLLPNNVVTPFRSMNSSWVQTPARAIISFSATPLPSTAVAGWPHVSVRTMAKKGGGGKGGKGGKKTTAAVDISDIPVDMSDNDAKISRQLAAFEQSLAKVKAGEVGADLLDDIQLEYEGEKMPLAAFALVAKKDAQTLLVTVFDESMGAKVDTAIRDAGLGLMPARQGATIRVGVPKMTTDYRQQLVKVAKESLEQTKVKFRRLRASGLKEIKSVSDGLGKDDIKRLENYVSAAVDSAVADAQTKLDSKVDEIMSK